MDVSFISFEDVLNGALEDVDVVINAGFAGSAWSGGDVWKNPAVVEKLTRFVYEGGAFIECVNEPSAVEGYDTFSVWRLYWVWMRDTGARICHGKWQFAVENIEGLMPEGSFVKKKGDYRKGNSLSHRRKSKGSGRGTAACLCLQSMNLEKALEFIWLPLKDD